jgi:recombination protein U
MGYWNTRGLRGSVLEKLIETTNEKYKKKGAALAIKIPTPITPVAIDKSRRLITKAYFTKKSSVDYIGVYEGTPFCFDAKETELEYLPIGNIKPHQIEFMRNFTQNGGVAFFIVDYSPRNEYYFLPFNEMDFSSSKVYYQNLNYLVRSKNGFLIDYIEILDRILNKTG